MVDPFRAELRRALEEAEGGPLSRRVVAGTMTAIVADARGGEADDMALAEVVDALARAGVPRGRQYVLLGAQDPDPVLAKERARHLRALLGIPAMAHDPGRATFVAGEIPVGFVPRGSSPGHTGVGAKRIELDDELREAEQVVLVGRYVWGPPHGVIGGPHLMWPGLASHEARLAAYPLEKDLFGATIEAVEVVSRIPVDFVVVWNEREPREVRAGTAEPVLAGCWGTTFFARSFTRTQPDAIE